MRFDRRPRGRRDLRIFPLLLLLASPAFPSRTWLQAQTAPKPARLSLEECLRLAQSSPSLVLRAEQEVRLAQEEVRQARSAFFPQLAYNNFFTYNTPQAGGQAFVALNGPREYQTLYSVTQVLDLNGRLRSSLRRSLALQAAAASNAEAVRRGLALAVKEAYFGRLLAQYRRRVAEETLQEAEDFLRRTRLLEQNGEVPRADVVKAEVQVASKRRALWGLQADEVQAKNNLRALITEDFSWEFEIEDLFEREVGIADLDQLSESLVETRPEFGAFAALSEAFRQEALLGRSERRPQLAWTYNYGLDATQLLIRNRGQAAYLSLNIPLFDWGHSKSRERQGYLRRRQNDIERNVARRNFLKEFYTEKERVRVAWEQIGEARRQVRLATESLDLAKVRYLGGETSILEIIDAINVWSEVRSGYYQSLADYHIARSRLEVATGR